MRLSLFVFFRGLPSRSVLCRFFPLSFKLFYSCPASFSHPGSSKRVFLVSPNPARFVLSLERHGAHRLSNFLQPLVDTIHPVRFSGPPPFVWQFFATVFFKTFLSLGSFPNSGPRLASCSSFYKNSPGIVKPNPLLHALPLPVSCLLSLKKSPLRMLLMVCPSPHPLGPFFATAFTCWSQPLSSLHTPRFSKV